jgi:hypothetical protein
MPVEHPFLINTGIFPADKPLFHNKQPINTKQKYLVRLHQNKTQSVVSTSLKKEEAHATIIREIK